MDQFELIYAARLKKQAKLDMQRYRHEEWKRNHQATRPMKRKEGSAKKAKPFKYQGG